jgi:RNA polymerase sigma-70 factor (ECF subfamily)
MLTTARSLLHSDDEAEDVVQEVLLKLFTIRDRIDADSRPDALAQVAVKHAAINVLRSANRRSMVEFKPEMAVDVGEEVSHTEMLASVLEIIDTLPSKQQIVLRLKHIESMEVEDIARVAQMSIDAVYQNLSRARRSILQKFIDQRR